MPGTEIIRWRLFLPATPSDVYELLSTDAGRMRFWCEHSETKIDLITLRFPDGETLRSRILINEPPNHYALFYFNHSRLHFRLTAIGPQHCDLLLEEAGLSAAERTVNEAGWISVLLTLKAAVLGVDLRNHDPQRCWTQGFVDN